MSGLRLDSIPQELRARRQWVGWRYEQRDGKLTKAPHQVRRPDKYASSTKPATWASFAETVAVLSGCGFDGIGYVFAENDPYYGVDFDACRVGSGLHGDVGAYLALLDTYAEWSPSGNGVHAIGEGRLNGYPRNRTSDTPWGGELEIYDRGRYFTFTGDRVAGTPATIERRQAQLEQLCARLLPPPEPTESQAGSRAEGAPRTEDDDELLALARGARNGRKFRALYDDGDITGYASESEAELALCSLLAFWTQKDEARMDRLFRSSALMRDKWDRQDYRHGTIAKAIRGTSEVYTPPAPRQDRGGDSGANGAKVGTDQADAGLSSVSPTISTTKTAWPVGMDAVAHHGWIGRLVAAIGPHSEADPVALLAQGLVVAGSIIGRGPHWKVEADEHHPALGLVLVGQTSKGRKGSSWGHVEAIGKLADLSWSERVESGLSSGEGLIDAVRDGDGDDVGVTDKRLLVFESEFASVLRVLERHGNRLSAVVRDAWDGRTLRTLTKTTASRATGAHISIVGHITADELCRYLDKTEVASGFANRFVWLCVKRSKALPEGGNVNVAAIEQLAEELAEAKRFARTVTRMQFDQEARALWRAVYPGLSEGLHGLVGAMTGRAEAQVMRFALVYALLDLSQHIRRPHLEAALALWDYSLRSVRHVFGNALGDPLADQILHALEASHEGLTRTDIRSLVGGRVTEDQISRALALLEAHSLAHKRREETGGRPAERWFYGRERSEETEKTR